MSSDLLSVVETDVLREIPPSVLVDEHCRIALGLLPTLSQPVSERTLARHVAAVRNEVDLDAVPDAAVDRVHVTLHHTHLPKLERAGILTRDVDVGVVTLTERIDATPLLTPETLALDEQVWTAAATLTQSDRRQSVLDVLADHEGGVSRMTLAMELHDGTQTAATDGGVDPVVEQSAVDRIEAALHHVDLPKLDDVGLVAYDPETGTVEPGDAELVETVTT